MSLQFKTKSTSRAIVTLVNIFNCLAYDWTIKDDERLHDMTPNGTTLDFSISHTKKSQKGTTNM